MVDSVGSMNMGRNDIIQAVKQGDTQGINPNEIKSLKRTGAVQCQECASRKYKDGSNESNVSYKAAAHISPSAAASRVRAHESEHVSNAYNKAEKGNGEVLRATVTLKSAVCPECGKSYVAGGVTNTAIKYNEESPYSRNQKKSDYSSIAGNNVDYKS